MFSIHFLYFSNSFCLSPLPFRIFLTTFKQRTLLEAFLKLGNKIVIINLSVIL